MHSYKIELYYFSAYNCQGTHSFMFKASLNLSLDTLRIISLTAEHLKINLRKPEVQDLTMNTGISLQ